MALLDINSGRTLWKAGAPHRGSGAVIFDVSPDGMFFAAGRSGAAGSGRADGLESKLAPPLEIRDVATGTIIRSFQGYSRFLHTHGREGSARNDETDFRKNHANIKWYKQSGYCLFSMAAQEARFSADGSAVLIHWANAREELQGLDRYFQMMDIAGSRELWFWQAVGGTTEPCQEGTRNAKTSAAMAHLPLAYDETRARIVCALPGGEIRSITLDGIRSSMSIDNIHRKAAGDIICLMKLMKGFQPSALCLSPDGSTALVTSSNDESGSLTIINLLAGNILAAGSALKGITAARYSPDGSCIMAEGRGENLLIRDHAGRIVFERPGSSRSASGSADFNPRRREAALVAGGKILFISEALPDRGHAPKETAAIRTTLPPWKQATHR